MTYVVNGCSEQSMRLCSLINYSTLARNRNFQHEIFHTDTVSINRYTRVVPPLREIIQALKLINYLPVQADEPWYNCYNLLLPK